MHTHQAEKMIDTSREVTYSLEKLAKKIPQRRSHHTIRRWVKDGCTPRGYTGKPIKLEYIIVGGCMHSSVEAYQRWVILCTNASMGDA